MPDLRSTRAVSEYFAPTLRLGVTGLARSGKTVFITALVRNLVAGGRLPFFSPQAEGRLIGAHLEPQPDDAVPRFDYEAHLAALGRDPPEWPQSTRQISELRVVLTFAPENRLRRFLGVSRVNLDIVDYPGEWLLDLAMLDQSFEQWSEEALGLARMKPRAHAADPFLEFLAGLDRENTDDEQIALEGSQRFIGFTVFRQVVKMWYFEYPHTTQLGCGVSDRLLQVTFIRTATLPLRDHNCQFTIRHSLVP